MIYIVVSTLEDAACREKSLPNGFLSGSYRVVLDADNLVFEERHGDGREERKSLRSAVLSSFLWLRLAGARDLAA